MIRLHAPLVFLSIGFGHQSLAQNSSMRLQCFNDNGGYAYHSFVVDERANDQLEIIIERSSATLPNYGIDIQGLLATKLKIVFPKTSCIVSPQAETKPFLFACSTKTLKLNAELRLLDGTAEVVTLPDNQWIESYEVETSSVFESKRSSIISVKIDGSKNGVGFRLSNCVASI
jgi:hypothetical protein